MKVRQIHSLLFIFLTLFSTFVLNAQDKADPADPVVIDLDKIVSDEKRDEIQRYFGYEDLLYRYVTLPYDLSSNSHQQGRYVDLGFAIMMLLPLVLLGILYKNKKAFYGLIILLILYLSLCISYSFHFTQSHGQVSNHGENWAQYIQEGNKPFFEQITVGFFNVSYFFSRPLHMVGEKISGNSDHVTYPILIGFLLIALWYSNHRMSLSSMGKFISTIAIAFGFLWLTLSSGIIWYGFLLFPLSYAIIVYFKDHEKFDAGASVPIVKKMILAMLILWMSMSFVGKVSNINNPNVANKENLGKGLVENNIFQYSTGLLTATETRDRSYANINDALIKINSNDALIYQVGTFFAFDIKNNPNRLFMDNTLPQFFWLVSTLKDKQDIIGALKAYGFKYILIDLYTHTLDKTPEKSLTQKYQLLLNTLIYNPDVKLLATDRVIEVPNGNGANSRMSAVFGEKIVSFGSYAIFEIL